MKRKLSNTEKYWRWKKVEQLREEYEAFLKEKGMKKSPHSAQVFAMHKHSGGYEGLTERQIIIELAGELPYMYD